ncbi:MAG: T9SS C-terminal target domain-containing protein, partial [Bacteroidetes bacterium]|nr:T9SS C-terminal target domain-containing protein [Bacteroidota bacterium]
GDGIIDNERFGMSRFLYHNLRGNPANTDPVTASDYYNYLRGIWKDGTPMYYGGNGHVSGGSGSIEAKYMFPANTDPIGWGTGGVVQQNWSEESEGTLPEDRRFAQSAGPFTLQPGAVNNITVGVVWARANSGGPMASVEKLKIADDKAQALFDNCFRILSGPDAPDVAIRELDRELIITLANRKGSNNYMEAYEESDFRIPKYEVKVTTEIVIDSITKIPSTVITRDTAIFDTKYRFQGYLIYQAKNASVTTEDLGNPDKARLVAQCDKKDSIVKLVNFTYADELNANIPEDLVINGENNGILHSFRVTEDKFAIGGDKNLVNFKTYYFIAVAYGHNNYKTYNPFDPDALNGQTRPYSLSRKAMGGSIRAHKAVPHKNNPENGGTLLKSNYGDMTEITRIEGQGNGGMAIDFTQETENLIVKEGKVGQLTYQKNRGPINVKVIDPVNVPFADFKLKLLPNNDNLDEAQWILINTSALDLNGRVYAAGEYKTSSLMSIKIGNEQLIPEIGISIQIEQPNNPGSKKDDSNGLVESSIIYSESDKVWLTGVTNLDGIGDRNWIRSGTFTDINNVLLNDFGAPNFLDPKESYEKILNGTWAPYALTSFQPNNPAYNSQTVSLANLESLKSVDIVFTPDKEKWTRCAVIEAQPDTLLSEGGARKGFLRKSASVDKNSKPDGTGNGMGWFPGYALCLETGERLNMAFAEDSWMAGQNGRDMI